MLPGLLRAPRPGSRIGGGVVTPGDAWDAYVIAQQTADEAVRGVRREPRVARDPRR